jgi:hypothetical protein
MLAEDMPDANVTSSVLSRATSVSPPTEREVGEGLAYRPLTRATVHALRPLLSNLRPENEPASSPIEHVTNVKIMRPNACLGLPFPAATTELILGLDLALSPARVSPRSRDCGRGVYRRFGTRFGYAVFGTVPRSLWADSVYRTEPCGVCTENREV